MDDQIRQAKEQALSRRDILDRVEKWKFAAEEEKLKNNSAIKVEQKSRDAF